MQLVDSHREIETGGERYLVERNVVLDVVCLFFGLWIIPGDVTDEFAVDVDVIVRGDPERECRG